MISSSRSFTVCGVVMSVGSGLLALAALSSKPAGASVMTGMNAYWNFDETSGTTAANSGSAGATLDGTLLEEAVFAPGLFGNAVSLPGRPVGYTQGDPTSYVNVGNQVIADGAGAYTVSLWFNTPEGSGRRQVLFESGTNYALSAGIAPAGRVEHYVQAGNTANKVTSFTPALNQWHHLAITYNHDGGSPGTGTSKIYINGAEYTDAEITSTGALGSTTYFRIGQHRYPYGEYQSFNGLIDDMAIWDGRTMTEHEVYTIYRMGQAGYTLAFDATTHIKADNTDNLNLGSSWQSGVAPDASSYLVFNATYAQTGALDTGGALPVAGLRVTDGTTLINVNNTSANYLQVGALGIDMMTAQRNLTVANLRLGADQSWDIGSGRTLSVGSLSGDHAVTKTGPGTVVLTGAGNSTGGATLTGGTLQVGHNDALGTGPLTLTAGTLSSNSTSSRTLANEVTISGNVTLGHSTNRGTLTFTGDVDLGGATRQITTNANVTLSGVVSDGGLIKAGGGTYSTLTLTRANTYAGGTTLAAGTLRVGDHAALGTGPLVLNAGTLSAVGTIARTLNNDVTAGGNITLGTAA
ncbi:MAG: LamG-like jellyroll fold domain-containing protein [Thermoguttaceae bacterium]|jgi:autotransporter-associated beta strand protein|nr:LamG-like jellyroll fold domain-containing protein [Thermoguttaceae bacterium]